MALGSTEKEGKSQIGTGKNTAAIFPSPFFLKSTIFLRFHTHPTFFTERRQRRRRLIEGYQAEKTFLLNHPPTFSLPGFPSSPSAAGKLFFPPPSLSLFFRLPLPPFGADQSQNPSTTIDVRPLQETKKREKVESLVDEGIHRSPTL